MTVTKNKYKICVDEFNNHSLYHVYLVETDQGIVKKTCNNLNFTQTVATIEQLIKEYKLDDDTKIVDRIFNENDYVSEEHVFMVETFKK